VQFTNEVDKCTNNIVEYVAILLGASQVKSHRSSTMHTHTNSKVVVSQIEKECVAREPTLKRYLALVRRMESYFKGFTVEYIEKSKNSKANELAKAAAHHMSLPTDMFFQVVPDASIKRVKIEPRVIN
jgi:ribonuclease HI